MEKVSIIVPVYNASDYVSECMESLLRQSYQNIEILLIDDHSSDNSLQILNKYNHNKKVKIFCNQKNLGQGPARNVGLCEASGSLVCFVDADDWVDEGYIEGLVNVIKKTGADLVTTSYRSQYGQYFKTRNIDRQLIEGNEIYPFAILNPYRNVMPSACTKIYRKKILDQSKIVFSSIRTGEDYEFNLKYMFECQRIILVSLDDYYYYRKKVSGSTTASFRPDYIDAYSHLIDVVLNYGKYDVASLESLRQLRAYELYTSCIRKVLKSNLTSREKARILSNLEKRLHPLVGSGFESFMTLLFRQRNGFDYFLRKLRSIFLRNMILKFRGKTV